VGQTLGAGLEVHGDYTETIDLSESVGYTEGYFGVGVAYDY
jgi:hypothetical protein